jgi:hypothetical protein
MVVQCSDAGPGRHFQKLTHSVRVICGLAQ